MISQRIKNKLKIILIIFLIDTAHAATESNFIFGQQKPDFLNAGHESWIRLPTTDQKVFERDDDYQQESLLSLFLWYSSNRLLTSQDAENAENAIEKWFASANEKIHNRMQHLFKHHYEEINSNEYSDFKGELNQVPAIPVTNNIYSVQGVMELPGKEGESNNRKEKPSSSEQGAERSSQNESKQKTASTTQTEQSSDTAAGTHSDNVLHIFEDSAGLGTWTITAPNPEQVQYTLEQGYTSLDHSKHGACALIRLYPSAVVKVALPHCQSPVPQIQIDNETRVAGLLQRDHPKRVIRQLGHCIKEGKIVAIALEKAQGSLQDLIEDKALVSGKDDLLFIQLTRDIITGLKELKEREDLVHWDMKPKNILYFVGDQAQRIYLKVADLGSTEPAGTLAPIGFSHNHNPPEVIRVNPAKYKQHAVDIYNAGLTTWEMLGKELPRQLYNTSFYHSIGFPDDATDANILEYINRIFQIPYILTLFIRPTNVLVNHVQLQKNIEAQAHEMGLTAPLTDTPEDRYLAFDPARFMIWIVGWMTQTLPGNRPEIDQLYSILTKYLDTHNIGYKTE